MSRIFFPIVMATMFVFGIFRSAPCPAQESDDTVNATVLEEMVVTAPPIIEGNIIDRYAAPRTIVTESQIKDLNAQDLATALRTTPGVTISRFDYLGSFGGGEGGGIFIRGMGSSRPGSEIKTFIDGVPMFMSVWNHPLLDLMAIDPAGSIEVYKSPQPQNFGNAYAAVNIVPKEKKTDGFVTKTQLAGGSYSTLITTLENGGKVDRFDYYVGGGFRRSNGHRDDSNGELRDVYGRLGYELSRAWKIALFTLLTDNYAMDPGSEDRPSTAKQGRYETKNILTSATLSHEYDVLKGEIKAYRNNGKGNWLDNPTSKPGVKEKLYNDFLFYGVKAKETITIPGGGELLAGVDWDYTKGSYDKDLSDGTSDNWDGHDFAILSPYTALNWFFGSRDALYFIPSAGVRYYDNTDFNSELAPHAGVILGYESTEVYANYARGVVYPGLEVVVMSEKVIPALKESWKNLKAEKTDHYEVGITQRFGAWAVVDISLFYDRGRDRFVLVPPPPPPPTYANIERFTIRGLEASVTVNPLDNLSLFAGLTLLDTDPSDLPYAPDTTVSGGLNYRFLKNFKLSLDGLWVSKMYVGPQARKYDTENEDKVDSYFLANTKISYAYEPESKAWEGEIFLAVENLTNEKYEYLPGYPMPGTNFIAGVNLTF
ncbi:MAG: TonB-dependent receptor [Deltaproteobacteria bacterium]|nr:TonB-dependent receptor [Deltaproteobacteria bacterium]